MICPECLKEFEPKPASRTAKFCSRSCSASFHKRKYPSGFDTGSRLYRIWRAMFFRCYQKSHKAYPRYGGRGIEICREWKKDYATFMRWAVSNGYDAHLEIDRKENDEGYSPDNCRWVTRSVQQLNKKNNRQPVWAFGEYKTPMEWTADARCRVTYHLLLKRLDAGWNPEQAIPTPSQPPNDRPSASTAQLGENNSNAKLNVENVRAIRASLKSESRLATQYGVSPALIGMVKRRKVWSHIL